jgi:transposase
LSAIQLLDQGISRIQVCEQVGCSYDTLTNWLGKYLQGGLRALVSPIRHQKPSRLSVEQQQQLKEIIQTQRPTDYGIERQMWTGLAIAIQINLPTSSFVSRWRGVSSVVTVCKALPIFPSSV